MEKDRRIVGFLKLRTLNFDTGHIFTVSLHKFQSAEGLSIKIIRASPMLLTCVSIKWHLTKIHTLQFFCSTFHGASAALTWYFRIATMLVIIIIIRLRYILWHYFVPHVKFYENLRYYVSANICHLVRIRTHVANWLYQKFEYYRLRRHRSDNF